MNTLRPIKPVIQLISTKVLHERWPRLRLPTQHASLCPDNDFIVIILRRGNPNKRNTSFFTLVPAPSHDSQTANDQMDPYFAAGWEPLNGDSIHHFTRFVRNGRDPFDILREMYLSIARNRGCDPFDLRCCEISLLQSCYTFVEEPGVHRTSTLELIHS